MASTQFSFNGKGGFSQTSDAIVLAAGELPCLRTVNLSSACQARLNYTRNGVTTSEDVPTAQIFTGGFIGSSAGTDTVSVTVRFPDGAPASVVATGILEGVS